MAKSDASTTAITGTHVAEFITGLRTETHAGATLMGMVKACPEDEQALLFAHAGDCSRWVKILAEEIRAIEKLGRVACQGHSHQLAHLLLHAPEPGPAQTFASLSNLHGAKLIDTQVALQRALATPSIPSSDDGDCPEGMRRLRLSGGGYICVPGS